MSNFWLVIQFIEIVSFIYLMRQNNRLTNMLEAALEENAELKTVLEYVRDQLKKLNQQSK